MMVLLKEVAHVSHADETADFWLQRRGTTRNLGRVSKEYDPQALGVKVTDSRILPEFLYYVLIKCRFDGYFQAVARGTLDLKHITIRDVENIPLFIPDMS